jgi:integrase/recombinase XerD
LEEAVMAEFRDRMKDDLDLLNRSESTAQKYLGNMFRFTRHNMRPPTDLDAEDIRRYLLYLRRTLGLKPATIKLYAASIKFFYTHTQPRPDIVASIVYPRVGKSLPFVLSGEEIERILDALRSPVIHALVSTIYATGLRISEVCQLRASHIDSQRGVIFVPSAKGDRDRYVPLPSLLLDRLRDYWRVQRPEGDLLFPSRKPGGHVSPRTVRAALQCATEQAGIQKKATPHLIRHCFATHLLELGVDTRVVQVILGHASPRTTARYTQISRRIISGIPNPLEVLGTERGRRLGEADR